MKRFLSLEWEAIAGIVAAVAAIVMHLLHALEIDILLTISVVLVAVLFIRDLRREHFRERVDSSLQRTEAEVKELQSNFQQGTMLLDKILERLEGPKVQVYFSREAIYTAIPEVIATTSRDGKAEKQLSLAALHGHSGGRIAVPSPAIPAFEAFDTAMNECIMSSGPGMWSVRVIFNITTEDRLSMLLEHLEKTKDADGYEVRAFSILEAIPHLSPLVVGGENVFISLEDPRYYRVRQAIHIENRDAVKLVTEYFNSLWNDSRLFILRSAVGINKDVIERLQAVVRNKR